MSTVESTEEVKWEKRRRGKKLDEVELYREEKSATDSSFRTNRKSTESSIIDQGLKGKLITGALYSSEGTTSPFLLSSLFLFY